MSPSPEDKARRPFPNGHAGAVCVVLVAAATMMMLWTWTGHTVFAAATCCAVAGVFAAGFVRAREGWIELVGGPLDGARIRSDRARAARAGGQGLLLAAPGGGRVRYGPDGAGRLVYQGHATGGDR